MDVAAAVTAAEGGARVRGCRKVSNELQFSNILLMSASATACHSEQENGDPANQTLLDAIIAVADISQNSDSCI